MYKNMYLSLGMMVILMFAAMYVLMYAMVDTFSDVYPSLNQFYMAALMTAPMIVIELALMWSMYKNPQANAVILVVSVLAGVAFFAAIRAQTAVADTQFLKSMIPHHSGAILMCQRASITDQRIKDLCKEIIASQRAEIGRMNAILATPAK